MVVGFHWGRIVLVDESEASEPSHNAVQSHRSTLKMNYIPYPKYISSFLNMKCIKGLRVFILMGALHKKRNNKLPRSSCKKLVS